MNAIKTVNRFLKSRRQQSELRAEGITAYRGVQNTIDFYPGIAS